MNAPITKVVVTEAQKKLVNQVLDSGALAQGQLVKESEEAFAKICGVKHAVAVMNGTIALEAALSVLDLKPTDEVIVPAFSFIATANAAMAAGATVRFADIDRESYNVDVTSIKKLVNENTKAVVFVHLYGRPARIDLIQNYLEERKIAIIEDSAQAHGAELDGSIVGSFGIGCFSFYATKNIFSGEGGMITTNDDKIAERLRLVRNQGMRNRYEYLVPGHNWRMTDLQAALLLPQLAESNLLIEKRRQNAEYLIAELSAVEGICVPLADSDEVKSVWHQFTITINGATEESRQAIIDKLTAREVGTGIYYPRAMNDEPMIQACAEAVFSDETPNARLVAKECLSIPVNQHLSAEQLKYVVSSIKEALNG